MQIRLLFCDSFLLIRDIGLTFLKVRSLSLSHLMGPSHELEKFHLMSMVVFPTSSYSSGSVAKIRDPVTSETNRIKKTGFLGNSKGHQQSLPSQDPASGPWLSKVACCPGELLELDRHLACQRPTVNTPSQDPSLRLLCQHCGTLQEELPKRVAWGPWSACFQEQHVAPLGMTCLRTKILGCMSLLAKSQSLADFAIRGQVTTLAH